MSDPGDDFTTCGRCGNPRKRMRCPDEWPESTVAAWRNLEERFSCSDCERLVVEWCAKQNIGDAGAHDATRTQAGQPNPSRSER